MSGFQNKTISIRIIIVTAILCKTFVSVSQEHRMLWTGAEFDAPLSKKLQVTLSPEVRFTDQSQKIDDILFEANARIRWLKLFQTEFSYRFSRSYDDPGQYFNGNRLSAGFRSALDIGRFRFRNRLRYMHSLTNKYSFGYSIETRRYIREGLKISYNIRKSKLEPFVQAEIYYDLSPDRNHEFSRIRYRAGLELAVSKRSAFEIFFQLQDKLNTKNPLRTYALGMYYSFTLPRPKPRIQEQSFLNDSNPE